jgi:hypothetical protein
MRNDWLPRKLATYVSNEELKSLNLKNVKIDRDWEFMGKAGRRQEPSVDKEDTKSATGWWELEKLTVSIPSLHRF